MSGGQGIRTFGVCRGRAACSLTSLGRRDGWRRGHFCLQRRRRTLQVLDLILIDNLSIVFFFTIRVLLFVVELFGARR